MANTSAGKKFETIFKNSWKKSVPGSFIYRLPDQMTGYKQTSMNPCDYVCFTAGKLFLMECKEHKGASIPFTAIPQYERLLEYKDLDNVFPGVTIWFSEKDVIIWISIQELEKMVLAGEKSVGLRMLENKLYNIIVLPAVKKRVFLEADYSYLVQQMENKYD